MADIKDKARRTWLGLSKGRVEGSLGDMMAGRIDGTSKNLESSGIWTSRFQFIFLIRVSHKHMLHSISK